MSAADNPKLAIDLELYASVDPSGIFISMLSEYPAFMSATDVAKVLGCSKSGVYDMCLDGRIPNVPCAKGHARGTHWRIPKVSVIAYMVGKDSY